MVGEEGRCMKRLFLLRHAKAVRTAGVDDHARPLSPRGISAAEAMAEHCGARLHAVDVALCSSAIRTRETLRPFERHLPGSSKIVVDDALHGAGSRVLMAALRRLGDRSKTALLVGHEPGLSDLVERLCGGEGKARAQRRLAKGFKTGSLAVLDLDIDRWRALRPGVGRLRALTRPKDLS
jgi:phosphohistidine phosphatase